MKSFWKWICLSFINLDIFFAVCLYFNSDKYTLIIFLSYNWYMLLIFTIKFLKVKCVFIIRLQEHSKVFYYINVNRAKSFEMHFIDVSIFKMQINWCITEMGNNMLSQEYRINIIYAVYLLGNIKEFSCIMIYEQKLIIDLFNDISIVMKLKRALRCTTKYFLYFLESAAVILYLQRCTK